MTGTPTPVISSVVDRNLQNDKVSWRFISQKFGGRLYLHQLQLRINDTGTHVMENLNQAYRETRCLPPYNLWDRVNIFCTPTVEVATLSEHSSSDLEDQRGTRQVFVTHRRRDIELTAALNDPGILSNATNFIGNHMEFALQPNKPEGGKQALLIGLQMSWTGIFVLMVVNLVVCAGSGIIAGILTERVDLGVAMTSGVAAVVSSAETIAFLLYK